MTVHSIFPHWTSTLCFSLATHLFQTTRFSPHHRNKAPPRKSPPGYFRRQEVLLADLASSPEWALHSASFGRYEESQHSSPMAERGGLRQHKGTLTPSSVYLVTRVMFFPFPTRRGGVPTKVPRSFREHSVGFPPAFGGPPRRPLAPLTPPAGG
jgi:hypothetical protein